MPQATRLYSELLRPALPATGGPHAGRAPDPAPGAIGSGSMAQRAAATQAAVSASALARARLGLAAPGTAATASLGIVTPEDGRVGAPTSPDPHSVVIATAVAHAMRDRGVDAPTPPRGHAMPQDAASTHPRAAEAAMAQHLAQVPIRSAVRPAGAPAAARGRGGASPDGRLGGASRSLAVQGRPAGFGRTLAAALSGRLGWALGTSIAILMLSLTFA